MDKFDLTTAARQLLSIPAVKYGLPCDCHYPCDSDAYEFLAYGMEEP